ncbi:excalibur calcium-binding domain-containing protein [Streptococcus ovuberis]|uniref:Excalibur calcium-binding domain-containing protein n=1 Tax=Streptococcus ovuberis TaxID=1936207 RepID=A0A7X6MYL1_9STRE|nr:excalibur calcium-binding domain-containing protein [Streptococcus ovuberis]NKZ20800.1 hypothetical protein [Streptococcus ovuberis]
MKRPGLFKDKKNVAILILSLTTLGGLGDGGLKGELDAAKADIEQLTLVKDSLAAELEHVEKERESLTSQVRQARADLTAFKEENEAFIQLGKLAKEKEEAEAKAREEAEAKMKAEAAQAEAVRIEAEKQAANQQASAPTGQFGFASTPAAPVEGVYYKNCSMARAAGVTPLYSGDPGYGRHLDRDGDGVACE